MTARHTTPRPLTDLQQAILDVVWSKGSATADTIREALLPSHPLKDASVRTLLRRLESRGYLAHRTDGKVFVYQATLGQQRVAGNAVRHLIDRFCAGSVERFVLGLVDERVLPPETLERLARKVRGRK
jgi:BlaI family penicillinase repressor